jgi:hypothetical protein
MFNRHAWFAAAFHGDYLWVDGFVSEITRHCDLRLSSGELPSDIAPK